MTAVGTENETRDGTGSAASGGDHDRLTIERLDVSMK